jgi:hypothetical protein
MKNNSMFEIVIAALLLSAPACKKDSTGDPHHTENKATLSIEFDNVVGSQNLQLNTGSYTNASGETFSISLLQYFISNISVKKADGAIYTVPSDSSYFLVKESDPATRLAKVQVPEGEYTELSFVLGVDSLRSTMDISKRTGALDPSGGMEEGMYWGWNSGYIFFKMEGISPQAPLDPTSQNKFRYHVGGFGGYSAPTINNIRTITVDLTAGGIAKLRSGRQTNVHLMVDIEKMFNGGNTVSIANHPTVMFSAFSVQIANNFAAMFRHDHTENR